MGKHSKTTKLLRQMRSKPEARTPIGTELFLPNHSGDHTAGTTGTPVNDLDLANKKYVDDNVVSDHGALTGLTDDDHTQYLLEDGTRDLTGNMLVTSTNQLQFRQTGNTISSDTINKLDIDALVGLRLSVGNVLVAELTTTTMQMQTTKKIEFRDTEIFIHSNTDGELTIEADTKVNIGVAGDIELGDSTLRVIKPQTDEKMDLGTSALRFNDFYLGGNIDIESGNLVTDTTTGMKVGTATSQKIGFFNATPIVQPTTANTGEAAFSALTGTAVNDNSTFGGYTIREVVQALQNLGLLA